MADSSVLLEVIVEGKNVKVVQKDVEKLSRSVDKTGKSYDQTKPKQDKFDKGLKGVSQSTANGTKAFSKMRDAIGGGSSGLVGAYATLAANVFAATAFFTALQKAAQTETLIKGIEALGAASGNNIIGLANSLREATDAAISLDQALRTASFGTSAGFDTSTIEQLTTIAKQASIALGRDVGDSVDRLIRGVAKLEPEILDELGLVVRLKDATRAYAASVGKTESQLSSFERTQAFANATIEQGIQKYSSIGDAISANPYDKLSATLQDLQKNLLTVINTIIGPLVSFLAESKLALVAFITVLSQGIIRQALPALTGLATKAKEAADAAVKSVTELKSQFDGASKEARSAFKNFGYLSSEEKTFVRSVKKGNKSVKEQGAFIQTLENRLKAKNARLADTAGLQETTIKKYERQAAVLERQIRQLKTIRNIEQKRSFGGAGAEGLGRATANQKYADETASILSSLEEDPSFDNFKKKFKDSLSVGKEYRGDMKKNGMSTDSFLKKVPLLGNAFAKASVFVASFGVTARVALLGITSAIPIIGQVILAFEVLRSVVSKVISVLAPAFSKQTAYEKAVEKSELAVKNYNQVLEKQRREQVELQKVLMSGTEEEKKSAKEKISIAQRTSAVGKALKEVNTSLEAQDKLVAKNIDKLNIFSRAFIKLGQFFSFVTFTMGSDFRSTFRTIETTFTKVMLKLSKSIQDSALARSIFGDQADDIIELTETLKKLEAEAIRAFDHNLIIQAFGYDLLVAGREVRSLIEIFEAGGQAATNIAENLGLTSESAEEMVSVFQKLRDTEAGFDNLPSSLRELAEQVDANNNGLLEQAEIQALITELLDRSTKAIIEQGAAVDSLVSSFKETPELAAKFLRTTGEAKTPITDLLNNLEGIVASYKKAGENNDKILFDEIQKLAFTEGVVNETGRLLNLQDVEVSNVGEILEKRVKELSILQERIRLEKTRAATESRQLALLREGTALNTKAIKIQNRIQKEGLIARRQINRGEQNNLVLSNNLKKDGIALDDESLRLLLSSSDVDDTRKQGIVKLLELREGERNLTQQIVDGEKERNSLKLVENEIAQKNLEIQKESSKLSVADLKIAAQRSALFRKGKAELSPAEEFKFAAMQAEVQIAAAKTDLNLTIAKIDLERALLDLRLKILVAEKKINEDERQAILANFDQVSQMQKDQANNAIKAAEQARQSLGIEALSKQMEGMYKGIANSAQQAIPDMSKFMAPTLNIGGNIDTLGKEFKDQLLTDAARRSDEGMAAQSQLAAGKITSEEYDAQMALIKQAMDQDPFVNFRASVFETKLATQSMIDGLMALGPDGVLIGSIASGILTIGDSIAVLGDKTTTSADKFAAASAIISSIGQIAAAAGQQKIAAIDKEIAAEKKRDGKSKESLAKIKQLEKKKEAIEKKNFETNKKIQMANIVMNTAAAIMQTLGKTGIFGLPLTPIVAALGAAQLAIVAGTSYQGGSSSISEPSAAGKVEVGNRRNSIDLATSQSSSGELAYLRGESGMGGPENFRPTGAFMGAKYRKDGGPTAGYVVGEQGPELFVPSVPGEIIPNDKAGMGSAQNVNISISAIDAAGVQDVLLSQRGNIIGMIREAANNIGEEFYEDIDTTVYSTSAGASLYGGP